ncbi:17835_t:CDS:2 [Entrophospora sp. SA101]|nr:17835_t:CDS:2 [Entrophospora sp. SA101]
MSALNSGWKSAVKKVKKIRNKVDNIIHNYPELPKFLLGEERRCENWMREQYVRCVVGIKLDIIRSYQGQVHRSMIAMLWTRQIPAPPTVSRAVPTLPGVFTQKWDFGTLQYNSNQATGCNGPGAPNVRGYNITVPGTVVGNNFVIDLYNIQQEVLASQKV